jgi:hypothetical protein
MRKQITEIKLRDDVAIGWVDLHDDIHIPGARRRRGRE